MLAEELQVELQEVRLEGGEEVGWRAEQEVPNRAVLEPSDTFMAEE